MKHDEGDHPAHQQIRARPRDLPPGYWILASTKLGRLVDLLEPYPCLCVKDCKGWGESRGERCLCRSRTDRAHLPMTCCSWWYKERKRATEERIAYGGRPTFVEKDLPRGRPIEDTDPL